MGRPRKFSEKQAIVPISLSWGELEIICRRSLAGQVLWAEDRRQVAAAAVAGADAIRLGAALGARGVCLTDNTSGWRLSVQGGAADLEVLRSALVWFEDLFLKGTDATG